MVARDGERARGGGAGAWRREPVLPGYVAFPGGFDDEGTGSSPGAGRDGGGGSPRVRGAGARRGGVVRHHRTGSRRATGSTRSMRPASPDSCPSSPMGRARRGPRAFARGTRGPRAGGIEPVRRRERRRLWVSPAAPGGLGGRPSRCTGRPSPGDRDLGCRSVDELFGLRILTREPDDDELERFASLDFRRMTRDACDARPGAEPRDPRARGDQHLIVGDAPAIGSTRGPTTRVTWSRSKDRGGDRCDRPTHDHRTTRGRLRWGR